MWPRMKPLQSHGYVFLANRRVAGANVGRVAGALARCVGWRDCQQLQYYAVYLALSC
jgi:hypothetical protein